MMANVDTSHLHPSLRDFASRDRLKPYRPFILAERDTETITKLNDTELDDKIDKSCIDQRSLTNQATHQDDQLRPLLHGIANRTTSHSISNDSLSTHNLSTRRSNFATDDPDIIPLDADKTTSRPVRNWYGFRSFPSKQSIDRRYELARTRYRTTVRPCAGQDHILAVPHCQQNPYKSVYGIFHAHGVHGPEMAQFASALFIDLLLTATQNARLTKSRRRRRTKSRSVSRLKTYDTLKSTQGSTKLRTSSSFSNQQNASCPRLLSQTTKSTSRSTDHAQSAKKQLKRGQTLLLEGVEKSFAALHQALLESPVGDSQFSGVTACTIVIDTNLMAIANVGAHRAVLGRRPGTMAPSKLWKTDHTASKRSNNQKQSLPKLTNTTSRMKSMSMGKLNTMWKSIARNNAQNGSKTQDHNGERNTRADMRTTAFSNYPELPLPIANSLWFPQQANEIVTIPPQVLYKPNRFSREKDDEQTQAKKKVVSSTTYDFSTIVALPLSIDQRPDRPDEYRRLSAVALQPIEIVSLHQSKRWNKYLPLPQRKWVVQPVPPNDDSLDNQSQSNHTAGIGLSKNIQSNSSQQQDTKSRHIRELQCTVSRMLGCKSVVPFGVSPVPEISVYRLSKDDAFVLIASESVWDVLSTTEAVEIIAKSLHDSFKGELHVIGGAMHQTADGDIPLYLEEDEPTTICSSIAHAKLGRNNERETYSFQSDTPAAAYTPSESDNLLSRPTSSSLRRSSSLSTDVEPSTKILGTRGAGGGVPLYTRTNNAERNNLITLKAPFPTSVDKQSDDLNYLDIVDRSMPQQISVWRRHQYRLAAQKSASAVIETAKIRYEEKGLSITNDLSAIVVLLDHAPSASQIRQENS